MGTTYYFARPDNKTLFDFERAYGLDELMPTSDKVPVNFRVLYLALHEWFDGGDAVVVLMAAIQKFADGQPVYFISEHYPWCEADEWYGEDHYLRVVGSRDDLEGQP